MRLAYLNILRYLNTHTVSPKHLRNRIRLMRGYQNRNTRIAAFPVVLQIEITNRCNLECIMCPRQGITRPVGDMDPALFYKIIDEAVGKVEIAILHLLGEPMLNPHLYEMIDYCCKAGIRTVLSTNATLLTEENAWRLRRSKLDVLILSLDGFYPEAYEIIRRNASYQKTREKIERFLKLPPLNHPHTVIQVIRMKETEGELRNFLNFWKNYPVQALIKPFTRWKGDIASINELDNHSNNSQIDGLRDKVCDRAWQWLTVYQDGTVVPCCRDYDGAYPVGNLKKASVNEVWNGELMVRFREQHLQGREQVTICHSCDYNPPIADSTLARLGLTLLDMYTVTRLMYDLEYGMEE